MSIVGTYLCNTIRTEKQKGKSEQTITGDLPSKPSEARAIVESDGLVSYESSLEDGWQKACFPAFSAVTLTEYCQLTWRASLDSAHSVCREVQVNSLYVFRSLRQ